MSDTITLGQSEDVLGAAARAEVLGRLERIESEEGVRILLAVESGSRAWGFHSPDSDYDVRFLYVRHEDAYLSLNAPRDVIETPIDGLYDVNGWDLGKALRLMVKGNSVVHEWLASPLVYRASSAFLDALRPIAQEWRNAFADTHHYLGLLNSQRGRFIEGREQVKLKKYFYVVRPALALQWLRERGGSPPMDLPGLLQGIEPPEAAKRALEELRRAKKEASELGEGPRVTALDDYIAEQADWAARNKLPAPVYDISLPERTDRLFRAAIRGEFGR